MQLAFDFKNPVSLTFDKSTDSYTRKTFSIETAAEIDAQLLANVPVMIGVSGGKDSGACAWATVQHLNKIGHTGPRVLIHADLGRVEWKQSHDICQQIADKLGLELVTVKRQKGDMMARWQQRWDDNVMRYARLECVKLILPWSTAQMRFCTSEMKIAVINQFAAKRWPGQPVISVTGIRRQESKDRQNAPVCALNKKLSNPEKGIISYDWKPIVLWQKQEVFLCHKLNNIPLHEAYTKYKLSRVSCVICVLGSKADHKGAASCTGNQPVIRTQVDLEIESAFSFQDDRWLGDLDPDLLSDEQREGLARAKQIAKSREEIEARIPKHLLYQKGWPNVMPTRAEAELLADVRRQIAALQGLSIAYTDADNILARYAELMRLKTTRETDASTKKAKQTRKALTKANK